MNRKIFGSTFVILLIGLWFFSDRVSENQNQGHSDQRVLRRVANTKPKTAKKTKPTPQATASTSAPTQAPAASMPQSAVKAEDRLQQLEDCYQTEGQCGFDLSDPKAEHFAIGQEIKKELLKIQFQAQKYKLQSPEFAEIARHHLKNPDGHVKAAALHLMSTQEISAENLDSILNEIILYHDAHLIQHAMLELTRYLGQAYDQKIHHGLSRALAQGAPFVSLEIAKGLQPFINSASFGIYSHLMTQLGAGSKTRSLLKVSLEEFERRQSAG